MRKSIRFVLLGIAVTVVGALGATSAQAATGVSVSAQRIGVSGVLTMNSLLTCTVLLELTLNSTTLTKTTLGSKGSVTAGSITNCNLAGGGRVLTPIPIYYTGFTGRLPNIERIRINAGDASNPVGFQITNLTPLACPLFGASPLYGGAADFNLADVDFVLNSSTGQVTAVAFGNSEALSENTSTTCPNEATIRGQLTVFLGTAPTVTLVD